MSDFQLDDVPHSERMSPTQMLTIISLERTGGCISLVAVILIFVAYWLVPEVRNVQNTFIVFASVANVGASIASIIAMDGLMLGKESSLCQAQSFMFEMFMQSDPWWSLAMAINVFLVFYLRVSPESFQSWWWLYCMICYGGPFVIALSLLLVRHPRGLLYGEATIWCWIDREWDAIRIYSYYLLIWICIAGSLILYSLVGYHVFRSRNQLRSFSTASKSRDATQIDEGPKIQLPDVSAQDNFYGTVVTEVHIVHSTASSSELPSEPKKAHLPTVSFDNEQEERDVQPLTGQYYSTVTSIPAEAQQTSHRHRRARCHGAGGSLTTQQQQQQAQGSAFSRWWYSVLGKFVVADPIKRAYLRTSFLFALSVLATWIPSSMNRIHSWLTGESPYGYHVSTAAVLPLQGLWNAVIFFVTSSEPLKRWWSVWREPGGRHRVAAGEDPCLEDGLTRRRSCVARDECEREGSDVDGEVGTMGSDVELRRMAEAPGKSSSSLS